MNGVRRAWHVLSCLLLFSLCMGGCGRQADTGQSATERLQETSAAPEMPSIAETEGQQNLRGSQRLEELNFPDPDLYLQELQGKWPGCSLQKYPFQLTSAGIIYREVCVQDAETGVWQETCIQRLEPPYEKWITEAVPFHYSDGEKDYSILEHYYQQGSLAFCVLLDSGDENWTYYLARCDGQGNVTEVLGRIPESVETNYNYGIVVNEAGDVYVCAETGNSEMLCLNSKLETKQKVTPTNLSWRMEGALSDASGEKVYWYGHSSNKIGVCDLSGEPLFETDMWVCGISPQIDMGGDGEIYVASAQKLWQAEEGELQVLCDFFLCDYPWEELYGMKAQEDSSILLLGRLDGAWCLARTVEEAGKAREERQEIIIAFLDNHAGMMRSISRFNRRSDQYHITAILKEDNEAWQDYDKRIQMEISAGKGPDIISGDLIADMSGYLRNGYFASLEGLIDDESQYLTAALEGGRTDGILYGAPYDFHIEFAACSEDFAGERDAWTLPELMKAVEASEAEILQYDYDGLDIVMWYGLYDNDNTAYIDWEAGESHLTEQPFLELLDFALQYADNNKGKDGSGRESEGEMLLSGKALMTHAYMYNFNELHYLEACFDGKQSLPGYPRTQGNGIYAVSRYLYVSSTSDCREGAMEFLRFLLSEEEQSRYMLFEEVGSVYGYRPYFPVNLNAFETLISYQRSREPKDLTVWNRGMSQSIRFELTERKLEQIAFLLDNVRPDNWYAGKIQSMIAEELEPYFAGIKSAEEAAEILNRRVQIYLDERK